MLITSKRLGITSKEDGTVFMRSTVTHTTKTDKFGNTTYDIDSLNFHCKHTQE